MKTSSKQSYAGKRIAIIDLGSNTIRLAVFLVDNIQKEEKKTPQIKELLDVKVVAGLSAYVKNNVFSDLGIDKATRVLKTQIERAQNLGCSQIRIFATAVLRNAENGKTATKKIEDSISLKIDLLSAKQEAKLGLDGARYKNNIEKGCLVDLGGGSCEITSFTGPKFDTCSIKMGCVSSYTLFVSELFPSRKEFSEIKECAHKLISKQAPNLAKTPNLYGIGGSVRAISKITREIKELEKTPKHVWKTDIEDIKKLAFRDPKRFSHLAVKAVPDRLHSLLPGVAIIEEIMSASKKSILDICKGGIREGYLLSII